MEKTDAMFKKGMEMLKNGEYKKAEEMFCRAKEMISKNVAE